MIFEKIHKMLIIFEINRVIIATIIIMNLNLQLPNIARLNLQNVHVLRESK